MIPVRLSSECDLFSQEVTVDMMDYDFLDKCTDTDLLRGIIQRLRSGEEGHYPHLTKVGTPTSFASSGMALLIDCFDGGHLLT